MEIDGNRFCFTLGLCSFTTVGVSHVYWGLLENGQTLVVPSKCVEVRLKDSKLCTNVLCHLHVMDTMPHRCYESLCNGFVPPTRSTFKVHPNAHHSQNTTLFKTNRLHSAQMTLPNTMDNMCHRTKQDGDSPTQTLHRHPNSTRGCA